MPARKKQPHSEKMITHSAPGGEARAPGTPRSYPFRGRTIEVVPPPRQDRLGKEPIAGKILIDGREVEYEQTDEGVYSHEMMYMRFSTPEELAEELVRQWGTSIPAPMEMPMHDHGARNKLPERPTRPPGGRRPE